MTTAAGAPGKSASDSAAPALDFADPAAVRRLANALRALAMDAVQAANSGHPGLPMGMADAATVLFGRFLKFDPTDPAWPDRDRFVLSAGHGSMLLYAILYLTGYDGIGIEDIKRFRQLGSPCAGHPEYGHAPGIETTTGPLGQGLSNAVGMALAERHLNARFGDGLVNHKTYVICSDGDLMEGISHEACSLAGHLKLNHLIVLYDDNHISIDGPTSLADSTDVLMRFQAMGWNASRIDGLDGAAVAEALARAQASDKPVLIACRTIIGYGAPKRAGTAKAHGEALGPEEVAGARVNLHWPYPPFVIPDDIRADWRKIGARGQTARCAWEARLTATEAALRDQFETALSAELPENLAGEFAALKTKLVAEKPSLSTRKASERVLETVNAVLPTTVGGAADLTGSVFTLTKNLGIIEAGDYSGRFIHYGIREHGMAGAMNGMALHGGVIPYSGTFLVFSDYCRPSIRLAAIMGKRVIHVMTHDSIGLGEDGPTHQPVEHLAALRAIPNLLVLRPADAVETAECWEIALNEKTRPTVMALSRQNLAPARVENSQSNLSARGGYVLRDAGGKTDVTLIATGSEIEIAMKARELLAAKGVSARVVSLPCWRLFDEQPDNYRQAVIAPDSLKVAIEAAAEMGWERYIGRDGIFIGMHGFGASGPYKDLYKHFGITAEAAADACLARLQRKGG